MESPSINRKADSSSPEARARGREAEAPAQIPRKGWFDVLGRTKQQLGEDNLSVVSAGVAFYAFVAMVPALAATIAIYGLVAEPSDMGRHLESLARMVPREAMPLLHEQMVRIASNHESAGWSAVLGIALSLYSSAAATKALMTGLNIAYDEAEKRSFLKLNALALILTLGAIVGVVVLVGLIGLLPAVLGAWGISADAETLLSWLRWPVVVVLFLGGLATLYRYGPNRHSAQWKWITPGAMAAAVLWLIGSAAFSLYVSTFGSYDKTYGPLGAVVVFLFWLYLSVYVVLFGAELNSEMERQTVRDTTEGPQKSIGQRGAYAADTVGPPRGRT